MNWIGLWQRAAGDSRFRCVHMIAWMELSRNHRAGAVAGRMSDGTHAVKRFFLRQNEDGDIQQLAFDGQDGVTRLSADRDLPEADIASATRGAMDRITAMHDADQWATASFLVLKSDAEGSLRPLSNGILAGETVVEPAMAYVISAAGFAMFPSPPAPERLAYIPIEHAVTGLPAIPMVIEELSLDGPDNNGVHHFRAGIRIGNPTDHAWARVETTATLFACSGAPLASAAVSIDGHIPARTDAVLRPSWPRLAAALLLNSPETFHVVVNAIAYAKRAHEIANCRLADRVVAPITLGRLILPGSIGCLSLEVTKRDADAHGNEFIDSRCVVQNLSPATVDHIEYVLELTSPQGDVRRATSAVSSLKPGLIWSMEARSWLAGGANPDLAARAILNVFFPAGYGSVQRQGETIGVEEEAPDNGANAALQLPAAMTEAVEPRESQHDLFPPTPRSTSELHAIWANRWREGVARFCLAARAQFDDKDGEAEVPRNTFYFDPDIPSEKLAGALKAYPHIEPEDVRMLIDDSFFGSAKACLILTDYGIYAYTGAEPVGLWLGEIQSIEAGQALLGTMSTLRINDDDFFLSGHVSRKSMNTLAELLEAMRCAVRAGR
jgi:hypothetical protein